jgi:hypothetical protein
MQSLQGPQRTTRCRIAPVSSVSPRNGSRTRNVDARFRRDEKHLMGQIHEFTNESPEVHECTRETTYTAKNIHSKLTTPPNRFIFSAPFLPPTTSVPNDPPPFCHDNVETRCIRGGTPLFPLRSIVTRSSLLLADLSQARRGERASSNHDAGRRGQNLHSYPGSGHCRTAGSSEKAEIPGEHLHLTLWPCEYHSNNSHAQ